MVKFQPKSSPKCKLSPFMSHCERLFFGMENPKNVFWKGRRSRPKMSIFMESSHFLWNPMIAQKKALESFFMLPSYPFSDQPYCGITTLKFWHNFQNISSLFHSKKSFELLDLIAFSCRKKVAISNHCSFAQRAKSYCFWNPVASSNEKTFVTTYYCNIILARISWMHIEVQYGTEAKNNFQKILSVFSMKKYAVQVR